jgi:asparagine synthase (glutamine-hydrolysing)
MSRIRLIGIISGDASLATMLREVAGSPEEQVGGAIHRMRAPTAWMNASSSPRIQAHQDDAGFCVAIGVPRLRGASPGMRLSAVELLAGYRASGSDLLQRMAGGFAFVAHDATTQRTLVAVDRFGIYPLAYRLLDHAVVVGRFADEVATLLPNGGALDLQSLFDYLYFHMIPAPATVYRSVRRLEAAQFGEFAEGRFEIGRYWEPDYAARHGESRDKLIAEFRDLMRESVAREADDEGTASYLSGGTDSSTVTGWLGKTSGRPARCYSIGFDAEGYDEMAYARLAAKHFGAEHHEYYVTPADIVRGVPIVAERYDQPFGNSSALPGFSCASRAAQDGVRVLLAGDGGDEIFGGNTRYAKQKVFEWYERIPSSLRRALLEPLLLGPMRGLPLFRKAGSYIEQAKLGLPARLETYNLVHRLGVANMLTPTFRDAVLQSAPAQQQKEVYDRCRDPAIVNQLLAYDLKYTLADTDLPKVIHTAELAGCEVRFPMLADELVDFANALPPDYKVKGVELRHFFKEASKGFLPDEILVKSKHGFGLPFGAWVLKDAELQRFSRASLLSLVERKIIRPEFVGEVFGTRLPAHPGFYGEVIWILMLLEQWLRSHAPEFTVASA